MRHHRNNFCSAGRFCSPGLSSTAFAKSSSTLLAIESSQLQSSATGSRMTAFPCRRMRTSFPGKRNSFGSRTAWDRPDQKIFARSIGTAPCHTSLIYSIDAGAPRRTLAHADRDTECLPACDRRPAATWTIARCEAGRAYGSATRHSRRRLPMDVRAAVATAAGKPLEITTVQLDGPKAGEVMVEIKATGICHTDEFTLSGADPEGLFPAILGHEGAGVVVEVGPTVTSVKKGDHVIPLYTPE